MVARFFVHADGNAQLVEMVHSSVSLARGSLQIDRLLSRSLAEIRVH